MFSRMDNKTDSSKSSEDDIYKIKAKDVTCSLGKPMTYEEMMEDRKKNGGGQVKPVDMESLMKNMKNIQNSLSPEQKNMLKQLKKKQKDNESEKPFVGRDGTVYNLQSMKERRDKKRNPNK